MADLSAETKNDLMEFQTLQQQLQMLAMQKQQFAIQSAELIKAGEEVENANGALYRFSGSVIVQKDKSSLKSDLQKEKESIELRLGTLSKQEEKLKEKFLSLKKKLESAFKTGGERGSKLS